MKTEQEKLIEQMEKVSPRVKKMLEPIKKLPPKFREIALVKLYEKLKG